MRAAFCRGAYLSVLVLLAVGCGSATIQPGGLRGTCYANQTCNAGLTCISGICIALDGVLRPAARRPEHMGRALGAPAAEAEADWWAAAVQVVPVRVGWMAGVGSAVTWVELAGQPTRVTVEARRPVPRALAELPALPARAVVQVPR